MLRQTEVQGALVFFRKEQLCLLLDLLCSLSLKSSGVTGYSQTNSHLKGIWYSP